METILYPILNLKEMNMNEIKRMKDLGYANGWNSTPQIIKECKAKGHKIHNETIGRCLERSWCEECGFEFRVDSGD